MALRRIGLNGILTMSTRSCFAPLGIAVAMALVAAIWWGFELVGGKNDEGVQRAVVGDAIQRGGKNGAAPSPLAEQGIHREASHQYPREFPVSCRSVSGGPIGGVLLTGMDGDQLGQSDETGVCFLNERDADDHPSVLAVASGYSPVVVDLARLAGAASAPVIWMEEALGFRIRVVSGPEKRPVAGVRVRPVLSRFRRGEPLHLRGEWGDEEVSTRWQATTGDDGLAAIPFSSVSGKPIVLALMFPDGRRIYTPSLDADSRRLEGSSTDEVLEVEVPDSQPQVRVKVLARDGAPLTGARVGVTFPEGWVEGVVGESGALRVWCPFVRNPLGASVLTVEIAGPEGRWAQEVTAGGKTDVDGFAVVQPQPSAIVVQVEGGLDTLEIAAFAAMAPSSGVRGLFGRWESRFDPVEWRTLDEDGGLQLDSRDGMRGNSTCVLVREPVGGRIVGGALVMEDGRATMSVARLCDLRVESEESLPRDQEVRFVRVDASDSPGGVAVLPSNDIPATVTLPFGDYRVEMHGRVGRAILIDGYRVSSAAQRLELDLPPMRLISGECRSSVDGPGLGHRVVAISSDESWIIEAGTDADGRFEIAVPADQDLFVRAYWPDWIHPRMLSRRFVERQIARGSDESVLLLLRDAALSLSFVADGSNRLFPATRIRGLGENAGIVVFDQRRPLRDEVLRVLPGTYVVELGEGAGRRAEAIDVAEGRVSEFEVTAAGVGEVSIEIAFPAIDAGAIEIVLIDAAGGKIEIFDGRVEENAYSWPATRLAHGEYSWSVSGGIVVRGAKSRTPVQGVGRIDLASGNTARLRLDVRADGQVIGEVE